MKEILNLLLRNNKQQREEENKHSYNSEENAFDDLDINSAIQAHLDWREKLENAIKQHSIKQYDVKIVGEDNHCILGKWIHNQAKKLYESSESYSILKTSHAKFHKVSAEILMDIHNENYERAKLKIKRDLSHSSDAVVLDLIRLFSESV